MTQRRQSTSAVERPRVRCGLGLLVGATLAVTALALASPASAQTGSGDALGGLGVTLGNTIQALPTTIGDPLGGPADQSRRADACTDLDGVGPFLTCLIDRLDRGLGGGQTANARVKARARTKVLRATSKVRWVMR